jgi:hypothetical protein
MTNSRGARSGRRVRSAIAFTALGLALPAVAAAGADTYIVPLTDAPLASYTGGAKGIPGTSPKVTRNKLKVDSAPGLDYRSYLAGRQKAVSRSTRPVPRLRSRPPESPPRPRLRALGRPAR